PSKSRQRIGAPPALDLAHNRIYFGASKASTGTLYAIDLNGNLIWKKRLENTTFRNTPPVVDASGNVYVAANRTIYAYAPSGAQLWTFEASAPFFAGPILGNGRLYAGSSRGRVYAIGDCS